MMDLQDGRWLMSCDNCDEVFDTETADKEEAIQAAMNNGWRVRRKEHLCETCAQEEDEDNDES